jgi:hypothetical protein
VEVWGLDVLTGQVSIEFSHLPLLEGLKVLLSHTNYALIAEGSTSDGARHVTMLVLGPVTSAEPEVPAGQAPPSGPPAAGSDAAEGLDRAQELERLAEQRDGPALSQAAALGDATTQFRALQLLGQQDPEEASRLAAAAATSPEVTRRVQALQLLGELDSPEATAPLGAALDDPEFGVRYAAVVGLMGQPAPAALQFLTQALQDPDASIRMLALEGLAQRGVEGKPGVNLALSDSDPAIQAHAREVWDQMP